MANDKVCLEGCIGSVAFQHTGAQSLKSREHKIQPPSVGDMPVSGGGGDPWGSTRALKMLLTVELFILRLNSGLSFSIPVSAHKHTSIFACGQVSGKPVGAREEGH